VATKPYSMVIDAFNIIYTMKHGYALILSSVFVLSFLVIICMSTNRVSAAVAQ